jgi:hypothetical protein
MTYTRPRTYVAVNRDAPALRVGPRAFPPHKCRQHISQEMFYRTCLGLYAYLRKDPEGALHGPATNDAPEAASEATGLERGTAATHAYAHRGTGCLPPVGPSRTLPLLRSAHERTGPTRVLWGGRPPVVEDLATPQSEAPPTVAPHGAIHPTLVSLGSYLSPLSATAPVRRYPRWEPDALAAPVRICGGGREQSRSLLRPDRRP